MLYPGEKWAQRTRAAYRRMIEACAAKRAGTPDEVGTVGALLMEPDAAFIMAAAAYWFGELAPK
jgi:hypothetical protein